MVLKDKVAELLKAKQDLLKWYGENPLSYNPQLSPTERDIHRAEFNNDIKNLKIIIIELQSIIDNDTELKAGLSAVWGKFSDRDWKEDFSHENGFYENDCIECKNQSDTNPGRDIGGVLPPIDIDGFTLMQKAFGEHYLGAIPWLVIIGIILYNIL